MANKILHVIYKPLEQLATINNKLDGGMNQTKHLQPSIIIKGMRQFQNKRKNVGCHGGQVKQCL